MQHLCTFCSIDLHVEGRNAQVDDAEGIDRN